MFGAHRVGMGSEAVVSRLIEVTILPLFRAVEIGPMDCPCNVDSNFHLPNTWLRAADVGVDILLLLSNFGTISIHVYPDN